jgi:hypothetical protein
MRASLSDHLVAEWLHELSRGLQLMLLTRSRLGASCSRPEMEAFGDCYSSSSNGFSLEGCQVSFFAQRKLNLKNERIVGY